MGQIVSWRKATFLHLILVIKMYNNIALSVFLVKNYNLWFDMNNMSKKLDGVGPVDNRQAPPLCPNNF